MTRILVIDDEVALTEIMSRILGDAGFKVETATSGQEGLQKAIRTQPDAVILDVMMPDMDGYEVCRRLRHDPRTARASILITTARGQPVDKTMSLQAGADLYLAKPVKKDVLISQVRQMLAQKPFGGAPLGRQIAVLHLQKGSGATTLAGNLASNLSRLPGRLTVIADLDFQAGRVSKYLGIAPGRSWLEAPTLGEDEVIAHLVHLESGLFVLPAPTLDEVSRPDPQVVGHLLQLLRRWFDFVVVDTPRDMGKLAVPVMRLSWLILLLLTPDPASLKAARAGLTALYRLGASSLQIWPVLNKVGTQPHAFARQVEKTTGLPVAAMLPWSPQECLEAEEKGRPLILDVPDSPIGKAIQALGQRVVRASLSTSA